jgi:hypothetical protein
MWTLCYDIIYNRLELETLAFIPILFYPAATLSQSLTHWRPPPPLFVPATTVQCNIPSSRPGRLPSLCEPRPGRQPSLHSNPARPPPPLLSNPVRAPPHPVLDPSQDAAAPCARIRRGRRRPPLPAFELGPAAPLRSTLARPPSLPPPTPARAPPRLRAHLARMPLDVGGVQPRLGRRRLYSQLVSCSPFGLGARHHHPDVGAGSASWGSSGMAATVTWRWRVWVTRWVPVTLAGGGCGGI